MVEQCCLNIVGSRLLVPDHIEDTSLEEFVGHEVLIFAAKGHHVGVGVDGTLQQQCRSHGHIELVHRDIALQCCQRIVRTVTAYGTLQAE